MATTKHPSQMDKRTKEYKEWAAAEAAKKVVQPAGAVAVAPAPELNGKKMAAPDAEKKAPTRPWEKKNGQRPWRRDYFNLHRAHEGFRPRFVDPLKVEGRVQRGYVVANPEHYGGLVDIDIRESQGLGKYISRHGMILMEIPEEGARAYENQNEERIKANYKKMKKEVRDDQDKVVEGITIESAGMQ